MWQLIWCARGLADLRVNNYVSDVVFQLTSKMPTNSLKAQCFNRITRESGKFIKFTAHIVIPLIPYAIRQMTDTSNSLRHIYFKED